MTAAARPIARALLVLCAVPALAMAAARADQVGPLPDKSARTASEKKIDSQLLIEIDRRASTASPGTSAIRTGVRIDKMERALVDIRAEVTPALMASLRSVGATVVSTSAEHRSVIAWVALSKLKALAANAGVEAIAPAPEAALNR